MKTLPLRYCIHPGEVLSANDHQTHFIDEMVLMNLYHVDIRECVTFKGPQTHIMYRDLNLLCLYPRHDGRYHVEVAKQGAVKE